MQQSASAATALITTKPLNGSKQRAETKRNEGGGGNMERKA